MHAVLQVHELLGLTFSFLDGRDRVSSAQVCHFWYEVIRPMIWETADFRIFRSLSPTSRVNFMEVSFVVSESLCNSLHICARDSCLRF